MATKTISITEEAYERLRSRKNEMESFSEVINRITSKRNLSDFFGILSREEADLLGKTIEKNRKMHSTLHEKRIKKIVKEMS